MPNIYFYDEYAPPQEILDFMDETPLCVDAREITPPMVESLQNLQRIFENQPDRIEQFRNFLNNLSLSPIQMLRNIEELNPVNQREFRFREECANLSIPYESAKECVTLIESSSDPSAGTNYG